MKSLGKTLFVAGILIAISAGAKLSPSTLTELTRSEETADADKSASAGTDRPAGSPAPISRWPDSVMIFVAGAVCGAVGLGLWWKSELDERASHRHENEGESSSSGPGPLQRLAIIRERVLDLNSRSEQLAESQLMAEIEKLNEEQMQPFAEARMKVISRLGMVQGSELLIAVAAGERLLNRTWSAAADHDLAEARASLAGAAVAFEQTPAV